MNTAIEIANELKATMPSIGFMSRSKRIQAYIWTAERAYQLADEDEGKAAEALAMLSHISKPFNKASFITALNIDRIGAGLLSGFPYDFIYTLAAQRGMIRR